MKYPYQVSSCKCNRNEVLNGVQNFAGRQKPTHLTETLFLIQVAPNKIYSIGFGQQNSPLTSVSTSSLAHACYYCCFAFSIWAGCYAAKSFILYWCRYWFSKSHPCNYSLFCMVGLGLVWGFLICFVNSGIGELFLVDSGCC